VSDNVDINGRKKRVVHCVSSSEFVLDNFLGCDDYAPGSPRHHEIIAVAWGNRISPPIRGECMENRDIRTNWLGNDNLLTRVERIFFHQ
jgi:hypothetical protein